MSYFYIWLCPTLDPETWIERCKPGQGGKNPAYSANVSKFGPNKVTVSCDLLGIDEVYMFLTPDDARKFFETGVEDQEFETKTESDEYPLGYKAGFDAFLYLNDQEIAHRAEAPGRDIVDPSSDRASTNPSPTT
jgi:hypothetical protein